MNVTKNIDHTLLGANVTEEQLKQYCDEAKANDFASVVVNSANVSFVAEALKDSKVNTVAVVGFPLGAILTQVKTLEAKEAVRLGATEIDMVINIGKLKDQAYDDVYHDIKAVVEASNPALVKVIIETSELTDDEKIKACEMIIRSGAHYVKTSTGFSSFGATIRDVELLKSIAGEKIKVKASGGIRDLETGLEFIRAGADRLGVGDGKLLLSNS